VAGVEHVSEEELEREIRSWMSLLSARHPFVLDYYNEAVELMYKSIREYVILKLMKQAESASSREREDIAKLVNFAAQLDEYNITEFLRLLYAYCDAYSKHKLCAQIASVLSEDEDEEP